MNSQTITFDTRKYFEGVFYILGWIFGLVALALLFVHWILSPIFAVLAFVILTARYRITIDSTNKEITDFLLFAGLKIQKETFGYTSLEYIYITQSRYTQRLHLESISSVISGKLYKAYLKTDAANHFLGEHVDLAKLEKKITALAAMLEVEIRLPA